jgi:hypothetical protein
MAGEAFSGSSAVGRYWQERCEGFAVRSVEGALIGTVDDHSEEALVVCRGRGRRPLRVSRSTVSVVDPWQRTIWVAIAPKPRAAAVWTVRAGRVARAGAAGAKRLGPPARASIATAAALASEAPRLVPPAKRVGRRLGYRGALLSAVVLWLYGVVVWAVVRVSLRVLLVAARLGARVGRRLYSWTASATNAAIAAVNARRLSSHA